MAWAGLLGLQLAEIQRFRIAPSDLLLALLAITMVVRERATLVVAIRRWTPIHTALVALLVALIWGSVIAIVRTGVLLRDAWLNKDLGWLVLALTVICVLGLVKTTADVRTMLRALLVGGSAVTWLAATLTINSHLTSGVASDLRFQGFLLNPSAEALYVSVLIVVQVASAYGRGIVDWPKWLQLLNAGALMAVLLATLSRSSWVATLAALTVTGLFSLRQTKVPLVLAFVLLLFVGAPLVEAIRPVATQVASGQEPATLRDRTPLGTPPPDLQEFASAIPTQATSTESTTPIPSTSAGPPFSPAPLPTASPEGLGSYVSDATTVASEQYGASDRLALDVIAIRLWLSSPSMALTGIGNGVFLQISPYTPIGASLGIHSTYVWLPVEMGIAGLVALIAFAVAGMWSMRRVLQQADFDLVMLFLGVGVLFAVWIAINEGLYQRTLWLALSLAVVVGATAGSSNRKKAGK